MVLNNLNIILLLTPILIAISFWCYFYCFKISVKSASKLRKLELKLNNEIELQKSLHLKEKELQILEKQTQKKLTYLKINIFNIGFSLEEILFYSISSTK